MLGLEHQLDTIDYAAANFVHADLSPREFQAAMQNRSETFWTMFSKVAAEAAAREARSDKPAARKARRSSPIATRPPSAC
jgi:hypothetical protein